MDTTLRWPRDGTCRGDRSIVAMTPEMICCGDARTPSWHNHKKCWPQGPCQQGLSSPSQQWVVPVLGSETAVAQYRPDAPTPVIKASEPSPHKLPSGTVAGSTTPGADPAGPVISASEPSPHRLPSGTVAGSTTPGIDPAGPVISASEPPGKDDQISLLVMMGGGTSRDCR